MCTNGVQDGVGEQAQVYPAATTIIRCDKRATLLRNVNLFLFVYVAQEIYQPANKGYGCKPECNPSGTMTSGRIRESHKSVKVVDRTDDGSNANHYRENVFQAFHLEPPASE
jgi:hypothetical protein